MTKYRHLVSISFISAIIVVISCKTKFEGTTSKFVAKRSDRALEHGRNLVYSICADCHYNQATGKFIGNRFPEVPGIVGAAFAANLTKSKTNGIAPLYTDAQLKYLLKTGIARDGRFISFMLRPNMSDEDVNDIIVYLRSNDRAVAAADTTVGLTHFNIIGKIYANMNAKPLPYKQVANRPPDSKPVALGAYLVDNMACFHCHSKSLTSLNYVIPDESPNYLAGGFKLTGENDSKIAAANITPDKETGIGKFTRLDFRKAIRTGVAPDGALRPPMPRYNRLTDVEVDAIYAYLKTVAPKRHKVQR